ncbi:MAG: hypothetical protein AB1656_19815 [Candidatus Omnitrophota bacterium]
MAIRGCKFLKVSKAKGLTIRLHALERIKERAGISLTLEKAYSLFCEGVQLRYEEMHLRGYRPAYLPRLQKGCPSWYFLLPCIDQELIAVVRRGEENGEYEWITTYAPDRRTRFNFFWETHPARRAA